MNINQKFLDNGFMYFKNVISAEEVSALRNHLLEFFKKHQKNHMFTREFLSIEEVSKVPFLQSVHEKVSAVIGSYQVIPFYSLTYNLHSPVWHRDSQSLLNSTQFIYNQGFQVSKCGIYLQDDTLMWGGGLEIIPKSHKPGFLGYKFPISFSKRRETKTSVIQLMAQKFQNNFIQKKVRLRVKAGDLLIFHGNLLHRASQPQKPLNQKYQIDEVPDDTAKFMYQWEVSPDNEYLSRYIEHQKARVANKNIGYNEFINQGIECRYPESYHPSLIKKIQENHITIANLS
jgi:ectoine hydroxylase-related dioxygenase (phytanoyl-CoA dioxygenase family)